eukprot:CAMPEP_0197702372 /NCGR_PEP_ID=MMETSP1338-20131121/124432_1 /TAXON_ID=43686 ORGANISM="Pelagodinium beii, Strain RCC1491" /NCGR_SAMPLE_ID=MMETSP1338 /ASSEMBLY_ACC=CAM_ASM_000754 /LENGTH=80 /DNA_ID=CAMNT_0043286199 /DNA_START=18 /DNA_END=257 /DNA_ORIENTATION=-
MILLAMPVGIVGSAFNETWTRRGSLLIVSRARSAIRKWGYTAADVITIFKLADSKGDGELNMHDFTVLFEQMRVGLRASQ